MKKRKVKKHHDYYNIKTFNKHNVFVFARILFIFHFSFFTLSLFANDCLLYKTTPTIEINTPTAQIDVVQPLRQMSDLHGSVVATMIENFEITGDTIATEDGFCVGIKSVDATIGYANFQISIDSRYALNSCEYGAILAHENKHVKTYLDTMRDNKDMIYNAVGSASNSLIPIFVKMENEIDAAFDKLNNELQSHPEIILINQKIGADQEVKNKALDADSNNDYLKQCK